MLLNPEIIITPELQEKVPEMLLGDIVCEVENSKINKALWEEINKESDLLKKTFSISDIKFRKAINATRSAYKKCGKDPNRYRPAAEQLCRRVLQEKALYQISTLVDLVNLVSLKTGYSIGGFDAENISGSLLYGVGKAGEEYEGIGRGNLNIEGMPVLRDRIGGIGTPTSDEMRTRISSSTTFFFMNINAFDGDYNNLDDAIVYSVALLKTYVNAKNIQVKINHA